MKCCFWFWVFLLFQCQAHWCFGCLEEERLALLDLKASLNYPNGEALPSWDGKESDCCGWERVRCSNTTIRRVVRLSLFYTRDWSLGPWLLNSSLFLPFTELHSLDLSLNWLYDTIKGEGLERLSSLKNMEILDLSSNSFGVSILRSIPALSSLKSLFLSQNYVRESTFAEGFEGLSKLRKLEVLTLNSNGLNNSILQSFSSLSSLKSLSLVDNLLEGPTHIEELKKLSKLESLDLSSNRLDGRILDSLGTLTELKTLDLSFNNLTGSLSSQGLCHLKNLEELDISTNNLEGTLPMCLGNLSSLRVLDLSYNQFEGNIASSPIANLLSLEHLFLSYNNFQSLSPLSSFANHSKLIELNLISGTNKLLVETEHPPNWFPSFQLNYLRLSNCTINKPTGVIPSFLYHQMDLQFVDLSASQLHAQFPSWLLKNNTRLESLYMQQNFLTGPFDLPPHSKLTTIDVSINNIHGHIPEHLGTSLPNLELLNISGNSFEGHIPSSLGYMEQLRALDLSYNSLSGAFPESVGKGCPLLEFLKLSGNDLHGQILSKLFNKTSLQSLYLAGNHFTGVIPRGLLNSSNLIVLDIRENNITGELPSWMGNLWSLTDLLVSRNHLQGRIPEEFCKLQLLEVLDLSNNNLTGTIPACFSPPSIEYANFRRNGLSGSIKNAFINSTTLVTLDVGVNNISGSIPKWIGGFLELRILVLKRNQFQGEIPIQLCNLSRISVIDLSFNNLSGSIPSCLSNLTFEIPSDSRELFVPWSNRSVPGRAGWSERVSDTQHGQYSYLPNSSNDEDEEYVEFTTKTRSYMYQGQTLRFVSGIDLSSNHLTGTIPPEIGKLSQIHTLNLSRNYLLGKIPSTFSNLDSIESLDLSYNNLSGVIPPKLVELSSLAVFSVAHNNLSGKIPDRKAQFATFDESSYEGNPFLCGPPLTNNCTSAKPIPSLPSSETTVEEEDVTWTNSVVFFASFAVSFVIGFAGVLLVLYINPYWRMAWFYLVDKWILCQLLSKFQQV